MASPRDDNRQLYRPTSENPTMMVLVFIGMSVNAFKEAAIELQTVFQLLFGEN